MIRFKNFENFNGEKKSLSIDMMIVQYVNPARKAHLLTSIEDFRKAWRTVGQIAQKCKETSYLA